MKNPSRKSLVFSKVADLSFKRVFQRFLLKLKVTSHCIVQKLGKRYFHKALLKDCFVTGEGKGRIVDS